MSGVVAWDQASLPRSRRPQLFGSAGSQFVAMIEHGCGGRSSSTGNNELFSGRARLGRPPHWRLGDYECVGFVSILLGCRDPRDPSGRCFVYGDRGITGWRRARPRRCPPRRRPAPSGRRSMASMRPGYEGSRRTAQREDASRRIQISRRGMERTSRAAARARTGIDRARRGRTGVARPRKSFDSGRGERRGSESRRRPGRCE